MSNPIDHSDQTNEDLIWIYNQIIEAKKRTRAEKFVEIGVRSGGGSLNIFNALNTFDTQSVLISIDPYGDKDYKTGKDVVKMDYGEGHYKNVLKLINENTNDKVLWTLYRMTSEDFMAYPPDIWFNGNHIHTSHSYGAVILDGEHETKIVKKEFEFFEKRLVKGGVIIIDNLSQIDDIVPLQKYADKGLYIKE
jgi:cephalosporin hydroxylase